MWLTPGHTAKDREGESEGYVETSLTCLPLVFPFLTQHTSSHGVLGIPGGPRKP